VSITASSAHASIGDWFKTYTLPSIADGNGEWVSCFFNRGSAYQDLTLRFRYKKNNDYSEVKFDNLKPQRVIIESITKNRISTKLLNKNKEWVKLRVSFSDGTFQMTKGSYMTNGICEEEK
jgi:hypothetical protein